MDDYTKYNIKNFGKIILGVIIFLWLMDEI